MIDYTNNAVLHTPRHLKLKAFVMGLQWSLGDCFFFTAAVKRQQLLNTDCKGNKR